MSACCDAFVVFLLVNVIRERPSLRIIRVPMNLNVKDKRELVNFFGTEQADVSVNLFDVVQSP